MLLHPHSYLHLVPYHDLVPHHYQHDIFSARPAANFLRSARDNDKLRRRARPFSYDTTDNRRGGREWGRDDDDDEHAGGGSGCGSDYDGEYSCWYWMAEAGGSRGRSGCCGGSFAWVRGLGLKGAKARRRAR